MSDVSSIAVAGALVQNQTLQELELWGDHMTGATALALAEGLQKNRTLKSLDLPHLWLSYRTNVEVMELMKENTTLENLGLASLSNWAEEAQPSFLFAPFTRLAGWLRL